MTRKSRCTFFIIFMILILGLSVVSAAEDGNETIQAVDTQSVDTTSLSFSNEILNAEPQDILSASNTYYVSEDGDDLNDGSESSPFKTIEKAVRTVDDDGSTIYIGPGTFKEHNLNVEWQTTFIGEDTIIDGENQGYIFSAEWGITLKGITFINAKSSEGGAIHVTTRDLTVNNCIFKDCTADAGGAIYAEYANVNIYSSEFSNVKANREGGAVYIKNKALSIRDSSFSDCYAEYGGAIYVETANVDIRNSEFDSNNADEIGGAIYIASSSSGTVNIRDSIFNSNRALFGEGGALFIEDSGETTITSSSFSNNIASEGGAISVSQSNIRIKLSNFTSNNAGTGGAINLFERSEEVDISNSTFTQNQATLEDGGAIYYYSRTPGNVDLGFNNFKSNSAFGNGGAVYAEKAAIVGGNFISNSAFSNGGAVYIVLAEIYNANFEDNSAYDGGAVYLKATRGANAYPIEKATFTQNIATSNGGAVYTEMPASLSQNTFLKNTAIYGGAVYSKDEITSNRDLFSNNSAQKGGAIYFDYAELSLENSKFYFNNALLDGGAIFSDNRPVNAINSEFGSNEAENGGAIYSDGGDINLESTRLTSNTAGKDGGAIYSVEADLNIKNSNYIYLNSAAGNGGAVFMSNGEITSSTFNQNHATNGGAIYLYNAYDNSATISQNTFSSNEATQNGGAVYNNVKLTFKDNTLSYNSASENGGGVYNWETLTLSGNVLSQKGSASDGYYIYNNGSISGARVVILDNSTVETHESPFEGYATYLDDNDNEISGGSVDIWVNGRYFSDTLIPIVNEKATFTFTPVEGVNRLTCEEYSTRYDNHLVYDGGVVIYSETYKGPFYVDLNGDDDAKGDISNPLKSISRAIELANQYNSIIYLKGGVFGDENGIIISSNVTIRGLNDAKIDVGGEDNIFRVTDGANLTLENLTLSGSKSTAIRSSGNLYLNNVTVRDNEVSGENGVLDLNSGTANIKDSKFSSNSGSAIKINGASVNIDKTSFNNNIATADGGAINHRRGNLKVSNSDFAQNTAQNGGAIYTEGVATLNDNSFDSNTATAFGGTLYNRGFLTLSGNQIENSNAVNGSKIYNFGSMDTVYLTFLNNSTITSNGGKVTITCKVTDDMGNYIASGKLTVTDNDVEIKTLDVVDGELSFESDVPFTGINLISGNYESNGFSFTEINTGIIMESAEKYNGPFYVSPTGDDSAKGSRDAPFKTIQKAIDAASIIYNSHEVILLSGTHKSSGASINTTGLIIHGEDGAVIDGEGKNTIFTLDDIYLETRFYDLVFKNTYGGAIADKKGYNTIYADNVVVINNTYGSAIYGGEYGNVYVSDSKFINNTGNYSGSAISAFHLSAEDCEFENNKIDKALFGYGGAVYAVSADIINSKFRNNSAAFGGDIFLFNQGSGIPYGSSSIKNSEFTNSKATYGGAIYNTVTLNLEGNVITNPQASYGKYIFNAGLLEKYILTFMDNSSVNIGEHANVVLNCKVTDDMGNPIHGKKINFFIDGEELVKVDVKEGWANISYVPKDGSSVISGEYLVIDDFLSYGMAEIHNGEVISHSQAYAGPYYVDVDGDDSACGEESHPLKSIQKAVELASHHSGIVYVKEGTYYESNLQVPNNVKIIGLGNAVIDAQNKDRIINVYEKEPGRVFEIANITLTNGNAPHGEILPSYITYSHPFVDIDEGTGGAINFADFGLLLGKVAVENVKFINNHADTGGAIFAASVDVDDKSSFTDNSATVGDNIAALEKITTNGADIGNSQVLPYIIAEDSDMNPFNYIDGKLGPVRFKDNLYYYYTGEAFNGSYMGYGTDLYIDNVVGGYITPALNFYYNVHDGSNVADLLKILLMQNLGGGSEVQDALYIITDEDYKNSNNTLVKNALKAYNDGVRYPNSGSIRLENGSLFTYEFKGFRTPLSFYSIGKNGFDYYQENLLLFGNMTIEGFNETVVKETLNKTVNVGDNVEFRITVFNSGNQTLEGVFVVDTYDTLLQYKAWKSEVGNWTYNSSLGRWILNDPLLKGRNASLILTFKTLGTGILRNNVTAGFDNITFANSTNTTIVTNSSFTVKKESLNKTVILGNKTSFKIIVTNTGKTNLTDVFILEFSYDDLIYDSFTPVSGNWNHKTLGLKHAFTLDKLEVGANASFIVVFNTTSTGNKTNVIVAGANETTNKTTNNTTFVYKPNLDVSKITLNKTVNLGDLTEFEIIVRNTGDVDLDNVFVVEDYFDSGIVYNSYKSKTGTWNYVLNKGKHQFNLVEKLKVGDSASFIVVFNTTQVGNKTNTVVVGYNNTNIENSTNITEIVNKTNKTPEIPQKNETSKNNETPVENHPVKETPVIKIVETPIKENKVPNVSTASKIVSKNQTGNPVLLILLAIFVGSRFRRKQ